MARKIAILGGTGAEGSGLAYRWAKAGESIVIGSRDAVRAATLNPARAVGWAKDRGLLAQGANADFVVLSPAGEVLKTVVGGRGF